MGIVKQHMADEENKRQIAVDLLKKSGYFESCENHEEITYTVGGDEELTEAYKLGMVSWPTIGGAFATKRQMTDTVLAESRNSDYANDGCEICRGMMAKD